MALGDIKVRNSSKELLGSLCYFDILVGLTALAMASACLAVAAHPGSIWNDKDAFGLGLFLSTLLAFILLRRRVSPQRMPWLCASIAVATVGAGAVFFRCWQGLWLGVGVMMLLFTLSLRSKTVSEGPEREDIYRVLMIVGSLFCAALLAEGTLRLFPELLSEGARARLNWQTAVDHPWHVAHPYIGHLHSIEYLRSLYTNTSTTTTGLWKEPARFDAWGFRNAALWPDRVDILTVGDSLTYSLTVKDEQAWPVLLERALAPRRVVNFGLVGAAPQQYLRAYETLGATLSAKLLVVGLFLGNDLTDALEFDSWWGAKRQKDFMDFLLTKGRTGINGWLQESYFYTSLKDLRASYQSELSEQGKTVWLTGGGRVQLLPKVLARQASVGSPRQPAFALVLQTVEHLCTLATQQQTHCLVLLFPNKERVYLPVFGEAAANLAAPFLPALEERGIAYIDVGPHFRQRAAAGEALFGEEDVHPNARGYALIAEVVLAYLQAHAARYGLD